MASYSGKFKGPDEFKGNKKQIAAWKKAGSPKNVTKFIKTYKADQKKKATSAAKKKTASNDFKGKYPGPDEFKGDQKKIAAWKKAGKPKIAAKPSSPKTDTPAAGVKAPVQVPVADSSGKLITPANWEADQARLASLAEDQSELEDIYSQQDNANEEYLNTQTNANSVRDSRMLAARRNRDEFDRNKAHSYKNLKTNTSYRGMGRSTAFNRGLANVNTEIGKIDQAIGDEQAGATKDYSATMRDAALRKASINKSLAPRRKYLSDRASRKGVYTK